MSDISSHASRLAKRPVKGRARAAARDTHHILVRTSAFFLLSFFASALLALPYLSIQ